MGDDIESFIAQQKAKLAAERQTLNDSKMNDTDRYRQEWSQMHGRDKGLQLSVDRSPRSIHHEYEKQKEKEEYKKWWFQIKGKYMEPGTRRQWEQPSNLKLSPRGELDTDSIVRRVSKKREQDDYRDKWNELHGGEQVSPRQHINSMTGGGLLDTDRIIREKLGEPRQADIPRRRADADSGLNNVNPRNAVAHVSQEDYRRSWEETHNQGVLTPRSQNVQNKSGAMLIRDDGKREGRLKQMEAERNQEYNEFMKAKRGYPNNSNLRNQTDENKSGAVPSNESDSVKWQKRKERNDEYNAFLAQKNQRNRGGGNQPDGGNNSLPRLSYNTSAQRRQRESERNREYNDMIQQKAQRGGRAGGAPPADVKTGWGTPDYSELLARKRTNEQNFRRANDIAYEADPVTRQNNANGPPSVRRSKDQGGEYFATLPLGRNTGSAQQRQKNQYSNDLKMQMQEAAQARQFERREGIQVNNNSMANPVAVARPNQGRQVDPYQSFLKKVSDYDELSPRSNAILGRRQPTSERLRNKGGLNATVTPRGDPGILELGLFNPARTTSLDPPAGLVYQPS